MDGSKVRLWLGIALVSFHLGISIAIVIYGRSLFREYYGNSESILLRLTLVQSSLLGTWAMLGKGRYWVRLPLSFLLLLWSAYSFFIFKLFPTSYILTLILICGQYFCTAGLIFFIQIILKLLKRDSHLDSSTRFSMGTLMIAVTLIAVSLGIGKLVIQQLCLPMEHYSYNLFLAVFRALAVVLILPALWLHHWRMKLFLFIPLLILVGILSVIEVQLISYFITESPFPFLFFVGINLSQAILFYITVFPLWRWKTAINKEGPAMISDEVINEELKGVSV